MIASKRPFAVCGMLTEMLGELSKPANSTRSLHMRLIDVSHTLESGMLTYKGLPAPIICDYLSRNLPCIVANIDPSASRAIDNLPLAATDLRDKAVLIRTAWDAHWRTDQYFEGFPYLTGEVARWLRDARVALVGIDSHNIDCTDGGERPVHSTLLGADIPIVEHLCGLGALPERGAKFFAVPVKVKGFGTFPVRAYAAVEG